MVKRLATILLTIAAAMVSGCISRAPVAPTDSRITIAPDLEGLVCVTDVRCTKGAGDFLVFQANMANLGGGSLPVEWKVQWLDGDGIEIGSAVSTWQAKALQPFEIGALKGVAPRPDAADMRFYARRAK